MNNFFKITLLFIIGISVASCSKSDSDTVPLRDFTEQYVKDLANIETFMHTHYMTVVNNPGGTDDQDVTFTLIAPGGTETSIWDQTTYPIHTREITVRQNEEDIDYKIYYITLRQGSGPNSQSPCNVDKIYTAYKGEYIFDTVETVNGNTIHTIKSDEFEESVYPQYFTLSGVIRGWGEIFPQFKTGSYGTNPDGTIHYDDFGAGVMFLPSGLGYFGGTQNGIPVYSPLIFNFKLYEVVRLDNDGDGIDSYLEDIGGPGTGNENTPDGYVYVLPEGVTNVDNTNEAKVAIPGTNPVKYYRSDLVPNFLDPDDDGDFFTTASEIKNPVTGIAYPYANIPTCGGTGNGKKKHLDPSCH